MSAVPIPDLIKQLEMDGIIRFRQGGQCVYVAEPHILKLYQPRSVRRIGGRSTERVQSGDIGFALRSDLPPIQSMRGPVDRPASLSMVSIANLPNLVRLSAMSKTGVGAEFAAELRRHVRALPGNLEEIRQKLDKDFLDRSPVERAVILARFLRALPGSQR